MASFKWFGEQEHRVFNYKPIYFDPEKEDRKQMFGAVDGSAESNDGDKEAYVPGSHLQGAFRDGNYSQYKKIGGRRQSIIGLITLVLAVVVLIFFAKFYMMLF